MSDLATAPGVGWVRRRFENATAGAAILPLVVLFFLYFFDEFDTAGLGTLAPEIKHAFHLTDKDIAGLVLVNLSGKIETYHLKELFPKPFDVSYL